MLWPGMLGGPPHTATAQARTATAPPSPSQAGPPCTHLYSTLATPGSGLSVGPQSCRLQNLMAAMVTATSSSNLQLLPCSLLVEPWRAAQGDAGRGAVGWCW